MPGFSGIQVGNKTRPWCNFKNAVSVSQ